MLSAALTGAVSVTYVVHWLLEAYVIVLFARALLSWFPVQPGSPLVEINRVLYALTEPVLGPIRRLIPPIGGTIDISIIIAMVVVQIVASVV